MNLEQSYTMDSNAKTFARNEAFWNNYLKGRPRVHDAFFSRIFQYHQAHNGRFDTAHDVGAGNGPHAWQLRDRFHHVIVSDVVPENVRLAQERLGTDGFSYRAAPLEQADDLTPGSVDLVFAANVIHFADQGPAMRAVAAQLRSGGTFACAGFGPARFEDADVQDVWARMMLQGGRVLLRKSDQPEQTAKIMARSQDGYDVAPLDPEWFLPGGLRVHLNMEKGGLPKLLSPEDQERAAEPRHTGPDDVETWDREEDWAFETNLDGVKEHFASFPFSAEDPAAFTELWREMERLIGDERPVKGDWPAKVILATRR